MKRFLSLLGLAAALLALAGLARGQAASEAAVKAAFLYKFAGYVDWPSAAFPQLETPFVIAVGGAPDVAHELERLVPGRSLHGRRIEVRRVSEPEDLRGAHMLYAGRMGPESPVLRAARGLRILSVTDGGLERAGGVISFVMIGNNVGFEVSLDAAERAGLQISSRMLAVAQRVAGKG